MNSEQLKAVQAPIKEQYRNSPELALVTMVSEGVVDVANQHCEFQSFAGSVRAGLHPAAGGTDLDACSAEILLESLVACAGVTFSAVATNMGIAVRSCRIRAEGDMDFRGTLGIDKSIPVGLVAIRIHFDIDADADADLIAKLISLTERYCVIYQTLLKGVASISTSSAAS
jgi:uncharacterized OsmC-like protein